jgi:hypothetical protein
VVSCGVRLSEVGLSEIRKPQVVRSVLIGGSTPHFVKNMGSPDFARLCLLVVLAEVRGRDEVSLR